MPKFNVQKEIIINQNKNQIKAVLSDLRQMTLWSPWNIIEPDADVILNDKQGQEC